MIIYTGDVQTESPTVTLSQTFINPFNIPLENTALGVFKAKAQIGFFESQENAYIKDTRLKIKGFELSKQHVELTINVTVENGKYVIDLHNVDLQVKAHMVSLGYDETKMQLTTEPIVE